MTDKIRELVRSHIDGAGLDLAKVSRQIGRNHAYLHQYLTRNTPRTLPEEVREKLAAALGLQPEELRGGGSGVPSLSAARRRHPQETVPEDRIRVLGLAQGSEEGWELWNGETIETVPRPEVLAGVPNAYAVYATGGSMEPRYYPFELLYIHPRKPAQIGDFVLIQREPRAPGEAPPALIKRLVKMTSDKVVVEQFNPPRTFEIKRSVIISMHKIVGSRTE